jgi:leader peptidase (prepilin peptidase)/N-methyltransferase
VNVSRLRAYFALLLSKRAVHTPFLLFSLLYSLTFAAAASRPNTSLMPLLETVLLAGALAMLSAIDAVTFRLPDVFTLSLAALGLLFALPLGFEETVLRMLGAIAGYLILFLVAGFYHALRGREGLGLGDAKLLAAGGAWLGTEGLAPVIFISSAFALVFISVCIVAGRPVTGSTRIAFGPFLAYGIWVMWLFRPQLQPLLG